MSKEIVLLNRTGRLITVLSERGGELSDRLRAWLVDKLTFFERKYNFTAAADTGSGFEYLERKLFAQRPGTGEFVFPIGLRPRIAKELKASGFEVRYAGGSLAVPNSPASKIDWDGLCRDFTLYPGQDDCLIQIASADGGIITATTGTGKSVIIRMICRMYVAAKIHVVTKSASLADEIYRDLQKVIPNVGFVGGGKKKFQRVTVFVADSLHHGMGEADIVLADEAHELVAPSYTRLLGLYSAARLFAFTATPKGRPDNRDVLLEAIFGPELFTVTYQEAQQAGRTVPITVEWLRIGEGPELDNIKYHTFKEKIGLWQNNVRNAKIADRVKCFGPDEQVLVMVKTIEHAVRLKSLLPEFTLVYAADGMDSSRIRQYVDAGFVPEDEPIMTKDRLNQLRLDFRDGKLRKVISNYVWSTGVNFPNLSILVRADAAASEIKAGQIPGRICRRVAGVKESALLIDCWDEWNYTFLQRSRSRSNNYVKRGWARIWADATPTI